MTERWKPIVGFEGRYDVSDHGRVRSHIRWNRKPTPRIMNLTPHVTGVPYLKVRLTDGVGGHPTLLVHRLVMDAFVGPCPDGLEVRHLDGDPSNNRLSNLQYGTRPENQLDAVRHGTHVNASKTHCSQGHKFTPENTISNGRVKARRCRMCHRERERDRYRRKVRS